MRALAALITQLSTAIPRIRSPAEEVVEAATWQSEATAERLFEGDYGRGDDERSTRRSASPPMRRREPQGREKWRDVRLARFVRRWRIQLEFGICPTEGFPRLGTVRTIVRGYWETKQPLSKAMKILGYLAN
jgi:hypothetical protein